MEPITYDLLINYLVSVGAVMSGIALFYIALSMILMTIDTIKKYVNKWKKGNKDDNY